MTALKQEIELHNAKVIVLDATIVTLTQESARLRCQLDMARG